MSREIRVTTKKIPAEPPPPVDCWLVLYYGPPYDRRDRFPEEGFWHFCAPFENEYEARLHIEKRLKKYHTRLIRITEQNDHA